MTLKGIYWFTWDCVNLIGSEIAFEEELSALEEHSSSLDIFFLVI